MFAPVVNFVSQFFGISMIERPSYVWKSQVVIFQMIQARWPIGVDDRQLDQPICKYEYRLFINTRGEQGRSKVIFLGG